MSSFENATMSPVSGLKAELQSAHDLLTLLQQEQSQLIEANISELETLTEKKSHLLTQLSRLAASRHAALADNGYQATESGMQYWIDTKAATAIANTWQTLLSAMRDAQEINRTNGLLINTHLGHNQASLNALQAKNNNSGNLYGPNGHSSTRVTTRGLIIG